MSFGGFRVVCVQRRRLLELAALLGALVCLMLVLPSGSGAAVLSPWGSSLSARPTMDTANGATSEQQDKPLNVYNGSTADNAIATAFSGSCSYAWGTTCTPWAHTGADNTVWNTSVAGGSATAPEGGQVLQVKVKGCAIEDNGAPTQESQTGTGSSVPVNSIEFQTLTPTNGSYKADVTAGLFQLPFCSVSSNPATGDVNTGTVTTYQPVHMCVNQGDTVDFYDLGGQIPNDSGPSYYPQGVPFDVISQVTGSGMDSFTDADIANGYSPGSQPRGNNSGWGSESNQEVMLQVIEGTGDDAYGQCPGGNANEPSTSNQVICVQERASSEGYPTCDGNNQPVYWPASTSAPTISGTAQENSRLVGTSGRWSNSPYGYAYQWEDCDSSGANCSPIGTTAAKQAYYYPTASDVGDTLVLEVWATNDANTVGPASSAPTAVVASSTLPPPPPPATGPPVITGLSLNPTSFNSARGATIVYNDSQTGTATLRIYALETGVTRGRSCVAPPKKKAKRAKKCTRQVLAKTLTHADRGGSNGVKLSGVAPGSYVLVVTAKSTANGKTSQPVTVNFTSRLVPAKQSKKHAKLHRAADLPSPPLVFFDF